MVIPFLSYNSKRCGVFDPPIILTLTVHDYQGESKLEAFLFWGEYSKSSIPSTGSGRSLSKLEQSESCIEGCGVASNRR
jgi:hypothetical protein